MQNLADIHDGCLHLSDGSEAEQHIGDVLPWLHDAGNPFYDWFYGGAEATRGVLGEWQEAILEMGAEPKGIFTVDFRSPDPNVLWCWTVEEPEITHRHFTWESFKDRVPIEIPGRGWPSKN